MAGVARMPSSARRAPARARRAAPQQRYMAFLSYSHADDKVADWLHQAIEQFRVPERLVGKLTDMGPVPRRLTPVFRDRHELVAAADLSEEIDEAIAGSRFLIVLCSPAAAKSRWIDAEIACFKKIHGEQNICAAIIDGQPFASEIAGREAEECFPPALRVHYDRRGRPTGQRAEPIAADLRDSADGRKIGLFKVIAGMLGVGLDDLAQREAQRRHRRLYLVTAASVAGMLFASGLAYTAVDARDEARDQRREADGLIGFMLGDLRERLEPVGRLDVLDAVGAKAIEYYEKQDKSELSDDALAQRSKALTLMGEVATSRGDLDSALRRYKEALAGTAEALRRHPNDPQRMFDHAQSVYYVGEVARLRGQIDLAAAQFGEYRQLAKRLIKADPDNLTWQLEGAYSATNLGIVQDELRQYPQAAATFQAAVAAAERLVAAQPTNMEYHRLLSEALAYLADALDSSGRLDAAIAARHRQLAMLAPHLARQHPDATLRQKAMIANMALSRLRYQRGETEAGLRHAGLAVDIGRKLVELEPANADWLGRSANTDVNRATLLLRAGRSGEAASAADRGCGMIERLVARDPTVVYWRESGRRCLVLKAELAAGRGAAEEARSAARQLLGLVEAERAGPGRLDPFEVPRAHKLLGDILWRTGDRPGAVAAWRAGLTTWPRGLAETPTQQAQRGEMLRGIGHGDGRVIAAQLKSNGYRQSLTDRVRV